MSTKRLVLIIVVILVIALPVLLYVVSQRVIFENHAAPLTSPAVSSVASAVTCSEISVLQNEKQATTFTAGSTVIIDGFCSSTTQTPIQSMQFSLQKPNKSTVQAIFLATDAKEKNTNGKYFFKAVFPDVKLSDPGTYTIMLSANSSTFSSTITVTGAAVVPTASSKSAVVSCQTLSAVPGNGPVPLTVTLTAKVQGTNISGYTFNFGNGESKTLSSKESSATITHTYTKSGTFTATVTASDTTGNASSQTQLCSQDILVTSLSPTTTIAGPTVALPTQIVKSTSTPTPVVLPTSGTSLPFIGIIVASTALLTLGVFFLL